MQDGKLDLEKAPWYPQLRRHIKDKAEEREEIGQRGREVANERARRLRRAGCKNLEKQRV